MARYGIVLGAGKGTRMNSKDNTYNKVCYPILGKPVIKYVLDVIKGLDLKKTVVVAGVGEEKTRAIVGDDAIVVTQKDIIGTGNAVLQAERVLGDFVGTTIVLYGDTPLLKPETIQNLVKKHEKQRAALTILTSVTMDGSTYNKIVRDEKTQAVLRINEKKETSFDGYSSVEIDGGVYVFDNQLLFKYLKRLHPDADHGEYSLISVVEMMVKDKLKIETFICEERQETFSINDRFQLAYAAKKIKKRVNLDLMLSGVSIEDPDTTYISPDVVIEPDVIIHPNTTISGKSHIAHTNEIGPNTYLENVKIGSNNTVIFSHIVDATIGDNNDIGPFTRMRGGCVIEGNSRVGNFVELKNAHFEPGVKCAHLTYIGDADVGEKTNIGCGSITANYDGYNKMHTNIGKHCFVGSGTILVAPVTMEDNSFTAAGSTITKTVHEDDMAIERVKQVNLEGYNSKFLAKAKAKKEASLKAKEGK